VQLTRNALDGASFSSHERLETDATRQCMKTRFTRLQGQYLAFIHSYTRLHGVSPAESDLQRFFGVTPPSVHDMVLRLHAAGLIDRVPGEARSLRVCLREEEIPSLERAPTVRHVRAP
jgi:DNA-binding MarR family transcriptional regulator